MLHLLRLITFFLSFKCTISKLPPGNFHVKRPPYGVADLTGGVIFIPSISCTMLPALSMAPISSLTKLFIVFSPLSVFSKASSKNMCAFYKLNKLH